MLTRDAIEGTSPPAAPPPPPRHRWWHASPAGLVVGTTFAALAVTPSLIPRDWTFQEITSAISSAIGYGVGAGGMAAVRWWRRRGSLGPGPLERLRERLGRHGRPVAWTLVLVAATRGVRVYAGLVSADDPAERARLAAAELARAGGLDRSVVLLTIGTGTGWVDASATDSLELVRGGDTATVAMQYFYLPSPLALVVDRNRSQQDTARLHEVFEW